MIFRRSAPLPLFFEVAFQLLDPAPGRFHAVDLFLLAVSFENLLAFLVILYRHAVRLGIVGFWTSLFPRQNLTLLSNGVTQII